MPSSRSVSERRQHLDPGVGEDLARAPAPEPASTTHDLTHDEPASSSRDPPAARPNTPAPRRPRRPRQPRPRTSLILLGISSRPYLGPRDGLVDKVTFDHDDAASFHIRLPRPHAAMYRAPRHHNNTDTSSTPPRPRRKSTVKRSSASSSSAAEAPSSTPSTAPPPPRSAPTSARVDAALILSPHNEAVSATAAAERLPPVDEPAPFVRARSTKGGARAQLETTGATSKDVRVAEQPQDAQPAQVPPPTGEACEGRPAAHGPGAPDDSPQAGMVSSSASSTCGEQEDEDVVKSGPSDAPSSTSTSTDARAADEPPSERITSHALESLTRQR
ncbi:hypothetical protein JCM8208_001009 [Rhodotorula glutinis]